MTENIKAKHFSINETEKKQSHFFHSGEKKKLLLEISVFSQKV